VVRLPVTDSWRAWGRSESNSLRPCRRASSQSPTGTLWVNRHRAYGQRLRAAARHVSTSDEAYTADDDRDRNGGYPGHAVSAAALRGMTGFRFVGALTRSSYAERGSGALGGGRDSSRGVVLDSVRPKTGASRRFVVWYGSVATEATLLTGLNQVQLRWRGLS